MELTRKSARTPFSRRSARGVTDTEAAGSGSAIALDSEPQDEESQWSSADNIIFAFFLVTTFSVTVLEKFGYVTGPQSFLPFTLPIFAIGLIAALFKVKPTFDRVGLISYLVFAFSCAISTALFASWSSWQSLWLLMMLYLPFVVSFETTEENYRRCMNAFIVLMLAFCAVTTVQNLVQWVLSYKAWPNLDLLMPKFLLIPGFVYIQPVFYTSPYMKPNGVFFLEVSNLSQYIALALAVEITIFRRPLRMLILAASLFQTFAGTGILLMALTLPVLLGRLRFRSMIFVIILVCVTSWIAYKSGWFRIVGSRVGEYQHNGTSANARFIQPLDRLVALMRDPANYYSGEGAGQIEKIGDIIWWPATKAAVEYGILPAIAFYWFFLYSLFHRAPYRTLAFVLAVWFSFESALLTVINPVTCFLLGTMLMPPRKPGDEPEEAFRWSAPGLGRKKDGESRKEKAAPWNRETSRKKDKSAPWNAKRAPVTVSSTPAGSASIPALETNGDALAHVGTPSTEGRLIYAIGDVHGRADLLGRLVDQIRADIAARPGGHLGKPMLVFLGDYVDRGHQSREVIDMLLVLQRDPSFDVRVLLGNHEDAMLAFLDGRSSGVNWGRHGGRTTLESYGINAPPPTDPEPWKIARTEFVAAVPADHVAFLRGLDKTIAIGDVIFVHAGLRAGVPLDEQELVDLLYIRQEFLTQAVDCGRLIVHGHTPGDTAYGAPGRLCLDTGAYASGVLTACRFDGGAPELISTSSRGPGLTTA